MDTRMCDPDIDLTCIESRLPQDVLYAIYAKWLRENYIRQVRPVYDTIDFLADLCRFDFESIEYPVVPIHQDGRYWVRIVSGVCDDIFMVATFTGDRQLFSCLLKDKRLHNYHCFIHFAPEGVLNVMCDPLRPPRQVQIGIALFIVLGYRVGEWHVWYDYVERMRERIRIDRDVLST